MFSSTKNSLAATAVVVISTLLLLGSSGSAQAFSPDKGANVSKAKPLIRSLYYGLQQASQRGLAAENAYILAHNYPGMYSNPGKCLVDLENAAGGGYGPGVPDLTTVDVDPVWVVPSGLPQNKLSNKRPKGDTYAVDVNWSTGLSTNHVTILNGKPYFYLWLCGS